MIIGYLFETFLGFSFALGLEVIWSTPSTDPSPRLKKYRAIILRGCSVFFDCAIYFAASIQIACVVVLVRKDFGISAERSRWSHGTDHLGSCSAQLTATTLSPCHAWHFRYEGSEKELEEAETSRSRHEFRFYLFCICWVLFLYTFVSRMIGDFAPSQVGQGAGPGGSTIINTTDWDTLNVLCFTGRPTTHR